jgi:hypothetical protein
MALLSSRVGDLIRSVRDPTLVAAAQSVTSALEHADSWIRSISGDALEAGARRLALTLGRTLELALLIRHAQWSQDQEGNDQATASARRFAQSGIDLIIDETQ